MSTFCPRTVILFACLGVAFPQYVPQGFPSAWGGDQYKRYPITGSQLPLWLDGFFFCQSSGSFGNQSAPAGQYLRHMFDGMGAVAVFDINPMSSKFSAAYYPTKQSHIWNFMDRNMHVAWQTFSSPYDKGLDATWRPLSSSLFPSPPSVDFWKIGSNVVATTEAWGLQMMINPVTLNHFQTYPFMDDPFFLAGAVAPVDMPVHERVEPDGSFYGAVTFHMIQTKSYGHAIFKVSPNGKRQVVGSYELHPIESSKCNASTGLYSGDHSHRASYMHSITSTKNYIILPMTSLLLNPCHPPAAAPVDASKPNIVNPPPTYRTYEASVPLRFLIFNKTSGQLITTAPLQFSSPQFVTHQWNAYENADGSITADMIIYDINAYDLLTVPHFTGHDNITDNQAYAWRFNINPSANNVTATSLLPGSAKRSLEFSQFNHQYEGLNYTYGYALLNAYKSNNSVVKINMNVPDGSQNMIWSPGFNMSATEPWFVPSPNSTAEDDGVLLVKALDASINKAVLHVVNATTMTEIGWMAAPDIVPFGFHNRYYSRQQLNMPLTNTTNPSTPTPNPCASSTTQASNTITTAPNIQTAVTGTQTTRTNTQTTGANNTTGANTQTTVNGTSPTAATGSTTAAAPSTNTTHLPANLTTYASSQSSTSTPSSAPNLRMNIVGTPLLIIFVTVCKLRL